MSESTDKPIRSDDQSLSGWARVARKEFPDASTGTAHERNWISLNRRLRERKARRTWRWGGLVLLLAGGAFALWRIPVARTNHRAIDATALARAEETEEVAPIRPLSAGLGSRGEGAYGLGDSSAVVDPDVPGFTVRGTKIIDSQGQEFLIKGVNINGPNWVWPRDVTRDVDAISTTWNFNVVRALTRIGSRPGRQPSLTNSVDKLVQAFTSRRVVVLFAPSDHAGHYYSEHSTPSLNDLIEWHRTLAEKYRNNPYVWFEVQGAPGDCTLTSEWLTSHRQVIAAIRDEAKSPNIIVAHAATWGGDGGCAQGVSLHDRSAVLTHGNALLNFDGHAYENIAFAVSVLWPQSHARLREYLDQVELQGLAIFVAQFGGRFYGGKNIETAIDALYDLAVPRKIGRVAYAWFDGHGGPENSNALTTVGRESTGAAIDNNDAPSNLSWLGKRVWADTHRTDGL